MPTDLALDLRNLSREYYDLMDRHSAYVNKLQGELRMVFSQYLKILSKTTTNMAMTLLGKYILLQMRFLSAPRDEIIAYIRSTVRLGLTYAQKNYNAII